jgi:hypothetical protein
MINKRNIAHNKQTAAFKVANLHYASCGKPPKIDADGRYVSYFENRYGEQWVLIGSEDRTSAEIRGGDIGWDRVVVVSIEKPFPDIVLNEDEIMWMVACLAAMSGKSFNDVRTAYNYQRAKIVSKALKDGHNPHLVNAVHERI